MLALGWKPLASQPISQLRSIQRADAEQGLRFAGLVVYHCPNKLESATSIKALKDSGHHLVMITGDQILTACHVARQLGMCSRAQSVILSRSGPAATLEWRSPDESVSRAFCERGDIGALAKQFDLCLPGPVMSTLTTETQDQLLEHVRVFARVSPTQKEAVLLNLKAKGHYTLMCGDGTNDVGALKASHVGVALLQGPGEIEDSSPLDDAAAPGPSGVVRRRRGPPSLVELQRRLEKEMAKEEVTIVRLGDASIASPFTCRQSSIYPTTRIIQQGRCTLVTTMEIYKIQALTCLTLAYCLSALYLDGVKLGDQQMMLSGMMAAMFFLFMSHAKPLTTLAPRRPPATIVCTYMAVSILGQFAVHMSVLLSALDITRPHIKQGWVCSPESTNSTLAQEEGLTAPLCAGPCTDLGCNGCLEGTCISDRNPDANFSPNILNSVVFLITSLTQVTTFAVNYKGRPYMQSLIEHKPLLYVLIGATLTLYACCLEIFPWFNDYLQLTPMPNDEFKFQVLGYMVADLLGAMFVEKFASVLFYNAACRNATDKLLA